MISSISKITNEQKKVEKVLRPELNPNMVNIVLKRLVRVFEDIKVHRFTIVILASIPHWPQG